MTTLAQEVEELNRRLATLERGPSVVGDWHRLDARAARALIRAQCERTALLRDLIDQLQMIRLAAQRRVFEHEAAACQRDVSNRPHG